MTVNDLLHMIAPYVDAFAQWISDDRGILGLICFCVAIVVSILFLSWRESKAFNTGVDQANTGGQHPLQGVQVTLPTSDPKNPDPNPFVTNEKANHAPDPLRLDTPRYECKARMAGTAGGNDPQDCDWPRCGCDPYANKVIEGIEESGYEIVPVKIAHPSVVVPVDPRGGHDIRNGVCTKCGFPLALLGRICTGGKRPKPKQEPRRQAPVRKKRSPAKGK